MKLYYEISGYTILWWLLTKVYAWDGSTFEVVKRGDTYTSPRTDLKPVSQEHQYILIDAIWTAKRIKR
jgi:hypothetical protein